MNKKKILLSILPLLVLLCDYSYSGLLQLPNSAKLIINNISDQCEKCLENGFSPTGTAEIGFGKDFFPNFFLGNPETGILLSHIITGKQYEKVLRENTYEKVKDILCKEFKRTKLFVIEKKGFKVHISKSPTEVKVILTKDLHQCLYNSSKPLCCCCTTNCESECCEKKLGSTYILVRWEDPLNSEQLIEYTYHPYLGASKIYSIDELGKRKNLRWCLDSLEPGFLQ
jgi:hypothetical protein